jgi:Predicted xylanase/chitin deacetylase
MNFIFKRIGYLTLVAVIFCLNSSCNKNDTSNGNTRGGIALTFDDYNVDNWYKYINVLDSLGVRATFYVSNYHTLTQKQKDKLHDIEKRGHEIAFHSSNHVNFVKYADTAGCDKLIRKEISNGLHLMNNDGFYPTTFAYPYGSHNDQLDKLLYKRFKSVRALNGTQDLSRSLSPLKNNKLIFGLGIDESSKRNLGKIEGLLYLAQQTDRCAILLVHNIERNDIQMQLPLWKLKEIILTAKSLSLKFYTIAEISK